MDVLERMDTPTPSCAADEKVDVACIKLRHMRERVTVVVRTFLAADKQLCEWASRWRDQFECEIDVRYADGRTVSSPNVCWSKSCGRPSLKNYVRASLQVSAGAREFFPSQSEMKAMRANFLDGHCDHLAKLLLAKYETED